MENANTGPGKTFLGDRNQNPLFYEIFLSNTQKVTGKLHIFGAEISL